MLLFMKIYSPWLSIYITNTDWQLVLYSLIPWWCNYLWLSIAIIESSDHQLQLHYLCFYLGVKMNEIDIISLLQVDVSILFTPFMLILCLIPYYYSLLTAKKYIIKEHECLVFTCTWLVGESPKKVKEIYYAVHNRKFMILNLENIKMKHIFIVANLYV